MALSLSGTLQDPYGNALPGAVIRFDSVATSTAVLRHIHAEATTDSSGKYSIQVEHGRYNIRVQQGRSLYDLARNVPVNADTSAGTLNQLIADADGYDELTPQIILQFIELRDEARGYRDEAASSAGAAETSAEGADQAAAAALASQQAAAASESSAASSETAAAASETSADASASAAMSSEQVAGQSAALAEQAATSAGDSQAAAAQSEANAASSETNSADSASAALDSEQKASSSEAAALASQQAAAASEASAATSGSSAADSATSAASSETNAGNSAEAAGDSASAAAASAASAAASESSASGSASAAAASEGNASDSATAAATSAASAEASATEAASAAASIDAADIVHAPGSGLPNAAGSAYSRDADELLSRSNHTGKQALDTISDAGTAAARNSDDFDASGSAAQALASAKSYTESYADPAGSASGAIASHELAQNPHPQYARLSEPNDFEHMPTVGGAPVVESGSNSDGEWVRWADGTQYCWASHKNLTFTLDRLSAGFYRSEGLRVAAPVSFDSGQNAFGDSAGPLDSGYSMACSLQVSPSASWVIQIFRPGSWDNNTFTFSSTMNMFAAGRWK